MSKEIKEKVNQVEAEIVKFKKIATKNKLSRSSNDYSPLSIGVEIVAGVLAGLIFGFLLDKLFASKPLFLIIGLIFGNIASARTIWRKMKSK